MVTCCIWNRCGFVSSLQIADLVTILRQVGVTEPFELKIPINLLVPRSVGVCGQ